MDKRAVCNRQGCVDGWTYCVVEGEPEKEPCDLCERAARRFCVTTPHEARDMDLAEMEAIRFGHHRWGSAAAVIDARRPHVLPHVAALAGASAEFRALP